MVPRLNERGSSFKGVSAYLFHDKGADTAERLVWAETLNVWTDDPSLAWREMAATWADRHALKKAAGADARGRDNKTPVLHYSLAWHPDQKPDKTEMMRAAQASIKALGLTGHQALILAHDDTKHQHVHVVVNTVDPVTGRSASLKFTKERLSKWAEAYERETGLILCQQRVENNSLRKEFATARAADPDLVFKMVKDQSPSREEWIRLKETAAAIERSSPEPNPSADDDANEWRQHRAERQGLKDHSHALADHMRQSIRDEFAPSWAKLYARQKEEQILLGLSGGRSLKGSVTDPAAVLEALTRHHSTFTRQDVARYLNLNTADQASFDAMKLAVETSPALVSLGKAPDGRERLTTRDMLATERRMEDHALRLAGSSRHWVETVTDATAGIRSLLGADQRAALDHITGGKDLAAVIGFAGTGKSTMLAVARATWEAAGYTVQGATLSGIAAEGLSAGSGIDARTIASLEHAWKNGRQQLNSKSVLVIDEAGLVGSRQMERILSAVNKAGAKLVLVGDHEQLQAIDAGGAFRAIVERAGAAQISTVRRQHETWQKQATADLATGLTAAAIDAYEAAGMVQGHALRQDAKAALIEGWQRGREADPLASQIILAFTHADVHDLNSQARAKLREAGQLGQDHDIQTERGKREFAAGDQIMFLQNDRSLGVKNGTLGIVDHIEGQGLTVRLAGRQPRVIAFNTDEYNHLDHGYAATIHKSQGVTVDRAHVLASANMDRHAAYVALSRHRQSVALHWAAEDMGGRDGLARRLSRERGKDTSLDYTNAPAAAFGSVITDDDRAAYIEANRERFAFGGQPLADADCERLASSKSELLKHVLKVHDQERRALSAANRQKQRDIATAVRKRHSDRFNDLSAVQGIQRQFTRHAVRKRKQEALRPLIEMRQAAQKTPSGSAQEKSAGSVAGSSPPPKTRSQIIAEQEKAYQDKLKREGKKPGLGRKFDP